MSLQTSGEDISLQGQDLQRSVLLKLPPPQHKVYPNNLFQEMEEVHPNNLFQEMEVGAYLKKQSKLKLEEPEESEESEESEDSEESELRQSFQKLPPPLHKVYPKFALNKYISLQRQDSEKSGKQELDERKVLEDWEYDSPLSVLHGKLLRRSFGKLLPPPLHKVGTNLKEDVKVDKNCENIEDAEHRNDKWELLNHSQDDEEVQPASVHQNAKEDGKVNDEEVQPASVHQMQNAKEDVQVDDEKVQPASVHKNAKEDVKVDDEEVQPASVHQMQNAKEDVQVDDEEVQPASVHQNAKENVKVDDEEVQPASVHQMQNAKEDVQVDDEEVQPASVHKNAKENVKVDDEKVRPASVHQNAKEDVKVDDENCENIDAEHRNDIDHEMIIEVWKN